MSTIPVSETRPEAGGPAAGTAPLPLRFQKILAATDFSEQATLALRVAAQIARRFRSRLHVLYAEFPQVIYGPGSEVLTPTLQEVQLEEIHARLRKYLNKIPEIRTRRHEEVVATGLPVDAIRSMVEAAGIDLIVMGSHGRGHLGKAILGSVAETAIRSLHCPVVVVGPACQRQKGPLRSVLFATDLSAASKRAGRYAVAAALASGAALTVVHAASGLTVEQREWLKKEMQSAAYELRHLVPEDHILRRRIHFEVTGGERSAEILRAAERNKAGLIVMGARRHRMLADHAPWATLAAVIRGARCPVMAVQSHPLPA